MPEDNFTHKMPSNVDLVWEDGDGGVFAKFMCTSSIQEGDELLWANAPKRVRVPIPKAKAKTKPAAAPSVQAAPKPNIL